MAPVFRSAISGIRRLVREARGGVSVIGALSLTSLIGMSGLAMEASQGYAERVSNQRIADAAALAAALAYNARAEGADANMAVRDAAVAIAAVNGVPGSGVTTDGPRPDGDARKLITVTVTTKVPLRLTRIMTSALSYSVSATGIAAVSDKPPSEDGGGGGCIIALSGAAANGIYMDGGTDLASGNCVVQSNAPITLDGGAHIEATEVYAGGAITRNGGTRITTAPIADKVFPGKAGNAVDPLADNGALAAALAKADDPASFIPAAVVGDPVTPDDGAQDWNFDWNGQGAGVHPFWVSGGRYVIPGGTYRVRALQIGGGVTVSFTGPTQITISHGFYNGGPAITVADGSLWKVNGGFDTGSGGVAMGNSSLAIGHGTVNLNNFSIGMGDLVINASPTFGYGTLSIGDGVHSFAGLTARGTMVIGRGDFTSAGRVYVGGGTSLTIGGGPGNAIVIGDTGGNSITVEGGGTLNFGPSRVFGTTGGITSAGGTTIGFGAVANHYINGTLNLAGSATFGSGAYTIRGDFTNGTGGAMRGTDVSVFLSGRVALSGGAGLDMRAPEKPVGEALPDILFATRTALGTNISHGARIVLSGVWWAPKAPFTMDGGTRFDGGGRCFTLIALTVTLREGGNINGAGCPATSGDGKDRPAAVALVR